MDHSNEEDRIPERFRDLRARVVALLRDISAAEKPRSDIESRALMLASRTEASNQLPSYYLVYFLLVDFLKFKNIGQWEKVSWAVPFRYQDRLYSIEHRKMGLGVFAPSVDPTARMSGKATAEQSADAQAIVKLIRQAVSLAEPYFEWRAEEAAAGTGLNVKNNSDWLFKRFEHFRERYRDLSADLSRRSGKAPRVIEGVNKAAVAEAIALYELHREVEWTAQAAIEAFFSWSEHALIHLAILQGRLCTGTEISNAAAADWKSKFKSAFDLSDTQTKAHYDILLDLRGQIRNFLAHGAFGKDGQAFQFHSGAGAVPILLTNNPSHRYSLSGKELFDEAAAVERIDQFLSFLWSGALAPARLHLQSGLPTILTFVADGKYLQAMKSDADMSEFVKHMEREVERAHNMDW